MPSPARLVVISDPALADGALFGGVGVADPPESLLPPPPHAARINAPADAIANCFTKKSPSRRAPRPIKLQGLIKPRTLIKFNPLNYKILLSRILCSPDSTAGAAHASKLRPCPPCRVSLRVSHRVQALEQILRPSWPVLQFWRSIVWFKTLASRPRTRTQETHDACTDQRDHRPGLGG